MALCSISRAPSNIALNLQIDMTAAPNARFSSAYQLPSPSPSPSSNSLIFNASSSSSTSPLSSSSSSLSAFPSSSLGHLATASCQIAISKPSSAGSYIATTPSTVHKVAPLLSPSPSTVNHNHQNQKQNHGGGDWNSRMLFNRGGLHSVKDVDKDTFWPTVQAAGDKLVVLDLYTRWCGPCRMIYPKLVKLSDQYDDVVFLKLDCSNDNKYLFSKMGVGILPTFKIFRNNSLVSEVKGAKYDELVRQIEKARQQSTSSSSSSSSCAAVPMVPTSNVMKNNMESAYDPQAHVAMEDVHLVASSC